VSTDVFSVLANPVRREILTALLERPRTVTELADGRSIGRPAVSEHLQVLVRAGLVRDERRGQHRVYHLEAEPLRAVNDWLSPFEKYWGERMRALRDLLDAGAADTTAIDEGRP
jgi:DNA-binding transcriptional ArsR family regulator